MILPSSPDAIVIRGGVGRDAQRQHEELVAARDRGRPVCLSVFAADPDPQLSAEDNLESLCRAAGALWNKVQVSSVHLLGAAHFFLADEREEDDPDCHYNVHFSDNVTQSEVQGFIDAFSEPVLNPVPKHERKRPS